MRASDRFPDRLSARLALSVLVAAVMQTGLLARRQSQPVPKNLLIVTIDTLRADRVGAYGYAPARTPNLDRLANEGVRFEKAYTAVPLTLPAHSSLFTGTYPPFHGVRDNSGFVLAPSRTTLAEILRGQGFATGAAVGAYVLHSKFGLNQGFQFYEDTFDAARAQSLSPGYVQRKGEEVVDQAIAWLDRRKDASPFFLWAHLYDPHDPYEAPAAYAARHPGRPYDAEIEYADAQLGRLVGHIEASGLLDETLIVVLGDHGESLGEHGELKHGYYIYQGVLHIPWMIRFPSGEHAGEVVSQPVSIVDVLPTIGQILGLPRRLYSQVQGQGRLASILGKPAADQPLYAETQYPYRQLGFSPLRALILDGHKYIQAPAPELYDLESDKLEFDNLAETDQALANQLRSRLEQWAAHHEDPSVRKEAEKTADPQTLARLQSLGYVAMFSGAGSSEDYTSLPDPKSRIHLYNMVGRLLEDSAAGRFQKAINGYREILGGYPEIKLVRYKLGQAYYETGQFEKALEQFQKTVSMAGDEALATFDLAMTYFRLGKWQEASEGFLLTLKQDPHHERARVQLGVSYKNMGRLPDAVRELEAALDEAPDDFTALANLGVAYSLSDRHQDAVRVLEQAVSLQPDNALAHANLGAAYGRMGNSEKAQEHLAIARRLNPSLFQGRRP